ncbi:DivIVA domain-containing protein [Arcanobacterium hippocoleae]
MSAHTFSGAGTFKSGYHRKQVDAFFDRAKQAYRDNAQEFDGNVLSEEDIRSIAFKWVRNGYKASEVDGALDRLERAFYSVNAHK